jgi:hypothetical protein
MANVDGVFWYTKHVHYTLVWILLWNKPATSHTNHKQVHLCACIWKWCVYVGKHGHKGQIHNEFKGAITESCLCS